MNTNEENSIIDAIAMIWIHARPVFDHGLLVGSSINSMFQAAGKFVKIAQGPCYPI